MSQIACRSCRNRFDKDDLTKLPFGDLICDACMQRECKMMDRDMMNSDDISLVESDEESSFSFDEKDHEIMSPFSSPSSSSSFQENNNIKLSHLKIVDDLIRYLVNVNYEEERLLTLQNSYKENKFSPQEADISLIRFFMNQEPSVSISQYEADLRFKLEEQTCNTSSTTSIKSDCSISEIDSNCSSTSIDIMPKVMIINNSLQESYEFDDMNENITVNKFPYSMFEKDLKKIRYD